MILTVEAKRAKLLSLSSVDDFRSELICECDASPGSSKLAIGLGHVFGYSVDHEVGTSRTRCGLRLRVMRKGRLPMESAEKLGLRGRKIGELIFRPELASLEVLVYLDDALFEDIANSLKTAQATAKIEIEIERKDLLAYADRSHDWIKWEIATTEKPWSLDVTGIEFCLPLIEQSRSLHDSP